MSLVPVAWAAEAADTGSDGGVETENKVEVPRANDTEHIHNSDGWHCTGDCEIPEHTHTQEDCYVDGRELLCGYHEHTDACYEADGTLICGKKSITAHGHTLEDCYRLICDNTDEDHEHDPQTCYELTCQQQEGEGHTHSDICYYKLTCDKEAHSHTLEDCYHLICNNTDKDHEHDPQTCYEFICIKAEHTHIQEDCYVDGRVLLCGKQESEGHTHSDICYFEFICDQEEHTHNGKDCHIVWSNCQTDYVLLTVEYYITVNDKVVRAVPAYKALLYPGDEHSAPIVDLRSKGYKIGEIKKYEADNEDNPELLTCEDYSICAAYDKDTKIIVNFVYENEYGPYRVDYWGSNIAGKNSELIYSYIGWGKKDTQIAASKETVDVKTFSIDVNKLIKNLLEILSDASLGESGETFINNLLNAVNDKYFAGADVNPDEKYHDITPLLENIAKVKVGDSETTRQEKLNQLTREELKLYIDKLVKKEYGFDYEIQADWDNPLTVTADTLAVRNLFFVPRIPQTLLFMAGLSNAKVKGIQENAPGPDSGVQYEVTLGNNYITTLPAVDISGYTENVYASHQSYIFVGWVSEEYGKAITDYTPENAKGKYKDITLYLADGDPAADKPTIPAGVKTEKLADKEKEMPAGGATYYGVWQPLGAPYTVQLWFESKNGDNTYVEKHTLDITRYNKAGQMVTFNEFDVNRAKEQSIIDAANAGTDGVFGAPIQFADPDNADVVDEYGSYVDYQNSPFFGFDFLECNVCKTNPNNCGSSGCTCGFQRQSSANGSVEGDVTGIRACNYQKVTVNGEGQTVLNLYYTREMWEIAVNPNVKLWTADCLLRPTEFNIYTYWVGGKYKADIQTDLRNSSDSDYVVVKGKYGTALDEAYKNGIGHENIGTSWQDVITDESITIPADTPILLANGSEAFQRYDDHPEYDGCYLYPQDTIKYINGGTIPAHEDWSIPFSCLSVIEAEMFTGHTAKRVDEGDITKGYTPILNKAPMWQGNTFGSESAYDLETDSYVYGTHRLNLYPQYHAISDKEEQSTHKFNINYYLQALPHEESTASFAYTTKNKDKIKFVKDLEDGEEATVTLYSPASKLAYGADTPEGFIPLMWRTSPRGFNRPDRGGFQGLGNLDAVYRYGCPQVTSTGLPNQIALASLSIAVKFPSGTYKGRDHNASFNSDHVQYLNGNAVYRSDWRQWYALNRPTQEAATVGSMDPGGYWIIDWIRAGEVGKSSVQLDGSLTGENGLFDLIRKADAGNEDAQILLDQLETEFSIGMLFPTGASENLYYLRNNANAFNHTGAGYTSPVSLASCENAVAFARNQYTITYNSCFLNEDGTLLRNEDGIVLIPIHTTKYETDASDMISDRGDMVYYDQPLGYNPEDAAAGTLENGAAFDTYYNNYYDAYFTRESEKDPTDPNASVFLGYGNQITAEADALGGYGNWYLDADGTIPFTEENLQKMPAGHVDVYFRHAPLKYAVYFVDAITGKDKEDMDVIVNGAPMTLQHVINHQIVLANTQAESFPTPSDEDHFFEGWFYDKEGTKPYSFGTEINKDTIVYAVWKEKVPTTYQVKHVLLNDDGTGNKIIKEEKGESYIGDTIDANALDTLWYSEDTYFCVDNYSQSMVLEAQNDEESKNILTFYYTKQSLHYKVEYRDINSKVEILPSHTYKNTVDVVTVGMIEIPGWEYQGYSVGNGALVEVKRHVTVKVTTDGVVVTFWYERIPADDELIALKLIDGVLSSGTRFHFELVDQDGNVVQKVQSVNGVIEFKQLEINKEGVYRYKIREVDESNDYKIIFDDTVYDVEIKVSRKPDADVQDPLEYEITYYKNGELYEENYPSADGETKTPVPVFENKRIPASVSLVAEKYLDDQLMSGSGFSFLLQGGEGILDCSYHVHDDGCYNLGLNCTQEHTHTDDCYEKQLICQHTEDPEHIEHGESCYSAPTTLIQEVSSIDGKINFTEMSFDRPGIYVYTIHERNDGDKHYQYDEAEYRVAVEVFINDNGDFERMVTITCNGEAAQDIKFYNQKVEDPADPGDSTDSTDPTDSADTTPPTGDKNSLTLWFTLLIASAAGVVMTWMTARKQYKRKRYNR